MQNLYRMVAPLLLLSGLGGALAGPVEPAMAAGNNYVVTRLDDPAPNGCAVDDCSLREAIIAANTDAAFSQITFALPGTVELSRIGMYDDAAMTGDLDLIENDQVNGLGAEITIVDANGLDRVFDLPAAPAAAGPMAGDGVNIRDISIVGGNTNSDSITAGGGIRVMPGRDLTLLYSVVRDNDALGGVGGLGGGIANEGGAVNIVQSAVVRNEGDNGGGIVNANGSMFVSDTTVSGNHPRATAGGVLNIGTMSGVTATLTLQNVTIAYNIESVPQNSGAGLDTSRFGQQGAAVTTVRNSIIANNTGEAQCYAGGTPSSGQIVSSGYNLSSDGSCQLTAGMDLPSVNPLLGALVAGPRNGVGTSFYHNLSNGSPALDSGDTSVILDQLGNARPVDLPGIPNATDGDDRGAIEMPAEPPTVVGLVALESSAADPAGPLALGASTLLVLIGTRVWRRRVR